MVIWSYPWFSLFCWIECQSLLKRSNPFATVPHNQDVKNISERGSAASLISFLLILFSIWESCPLLVTLVANSFQWMTEFWSRCSRCWVSSLVILCQACTASIFSYSLSLWHSAFSFAFGKWNLYSVGFRPGDWLGHCRIFDFFALKKLGLGLLSKYALCPIQFWSIWLNVSTEYNALQLRKHLAAFVSLIFNKWKSEPFPPVAKHAHAIRKVVYFGSSAVSFLLHFFPSFLKKVDHCLICP